MNVDKYILKKRDSIREKKLARFVRNLPEEERFVFIQEYIKKSPIIGLRLANSCLRKKEHFLIIMKEGVLSEDASSIDFWFECCFPRLGPKRITDLLYSMREESPNEVLRAIYKAVVWVGKHDEKLGKKLQELERDIAESHNF